MRVLAISEHYFPILGGSTTYVYNICRALGEIGCEVSLVTIPDDKNPVNEWCVEETFHVYRLNIPRFLRKERYFPFITASKLNKIIEEVKPDIIHFVHGFFAPLVTRLNPLGEPVVWTIQNVPSYEDRLNLPRGMRPLRPVLEPIYLGVADVYGRLALKVSIYDLLICVSENTAKAALARGASKDKIRIIPNGVDPGVFKLKGDPGELGINGYAPVVLTVAGITPTKGLHFLLESVPRVVEKHPRALFIILGPIRSKEYYDALMKHASGLGVEERVRIIPGMSQEEVIRYYSSCDVYVQPSLEEGFCMAVLEAMASGKAVVGTRTGAIPQLLRESRGGLLVDPAAPKQLGDALLRLLESPGERRKMGTRARKYVAENYGWKKIAGKTLELYQGLIRG